MASRRQERARVKARRAQQKQARARSRWLGLVQQRLDATGIHEAAAQAWQDLTVFGTGAVHVAEDGQVRAVDPRNVVFGTDPAQPGGDRTVVARWRTDPLAFARESFARAEDRAFISALNTPARPWFRFRPSSRFARPPLRQEWCNARVVKPHVREVNGYLFPYEPPTPEQDMLDLTAEYEGGAACGMLFPRRREYIERRLAYLDVMLESLSETSAARWSGPVPRWFVEFRECTPALPALVDVMNQLDPDYLTEHLIRRNPFLEEALANAMDRMTEETGREPRNFYMSRDAFQRLEREVVQSHPSLVTAPLQPESDHLLATFMGIPVRVVEGMPRNEVRIESGVRGRHYDRVWIDEMQMMSPAEQVMREHEARMAQLTPVLNQLQQDLLSPSIDRVLNLLQRQADKVVNPPHVIRSKK